MNVKVRLFDTLHRFAPSEARNGEFTLKVGSESTLKDLIKMCGLSEESITVAMINGMIAHLGSRLNDQDEINIFPPLVGE